MHRCDARESYQNIEVPEICDLHPRERVEEAKAQPRPPEDNETLARPEVFNEPYHVSEVEERK